MLVTSNMPATQPESNGQHTIAPGALAPFFLVTFLFFLWGVSNNLNDVLIRQFMKSFAISRFQAGLVQSAFYLGYFLFATPAALIMKKKGYKTGMLTGLMLFALGAFLFWPAALASSYAFFLIALFIIASGLAFLETTSNSYIAQLGPTSTAARRLNVSQAFNSVGAICGVLIGTVFIFSGIELTLEQIATLQKAKQYHLYLQHETMRVVLPYVIIGIIALAWAALIYFSKLPSKAEASGENGETDNGHGSFLEVFGNKHFRLAVFAQFMYVGTQVGTWSYFIQYVLDYTRQSEKMAGYFLTGTLVAFTLGRFTSAGLMRYVRPARLMGVYCLINVALLAIAILHPGWIGLWTLFLTSFFMAPMFPTIFALGLEGLGRNTAIGSSSLIMAIIGGAVLTPIMGWIAQATHSIAFAYVVPMAGFLVISAFSFLTVKRQQAKTAV